MTLELATQLGESKVPYKILPYSQNYFKNLPVNWKYGDHSVGGMLVLNGTGLSGEASLLELLQDHTRFCTSKKRC
jgi:hypothetical protein